MRANRKTLSRFTYQQITSPERDASSSIPSLTGQKVLRIIDKDVFHSGIQDDRTKGSFGASPENPPRVLIRNVDTNDVFLRLLVFFFRIDKDIVEDVV